MTSKNKPYNEIYSTARLNLLVTLMLCEFYSLINEYVIEFSKAKAFLLEVSKDQISKAFIKKTHFKKQHAPDNWIDRKFIQDSSEEAILLVNIAKCCSNLVFTPNDEEVMCKIKELGFRNLSSYFVQLEDIIDDLNKIEEQGYWVYQPGVLTVIKAYLKLKTLNIVQYEMGFSQLHDTKPINRTAKGLIDLYKRYRYHKTKAGYHNTIDHFIIGKLNKAKEITKGLLNEKVMMKVAKGNVERILLPLIPDLIFCDDGQDNMDAKLIVCYPLLRRLLPEKFLPDVNSISDSKKAYKLKRLIYPKTFSDE